jgi:Ca2+-binding EF-hand superfamily protein
VRVGIPGDVNGDGYVGIDDIFEIASHFGQEPWHPLWDAKYDITDDGYIGIDDIFTAAQHFGQEENP